MLELAILGLVLSALAYRIGVERGRRLATGPRELWGKRIQSDSPPLAEQVADIARGLGYPEDEIQEAISKEGPQKTLHYLKTFGHRA